MRQFPIARLCGILAGFAAASTIVAPSAGQGVAEPAPFVSRQLAPKGEYPKGIEGPAVDKRGALYVVNFGKAGTIGRLDPGATTSVLFAQLPNGGIGNGLRFDRQGRMYVAVPSAQ